MFQTRNKQERFRANSLTSDEISRPDSPQSSILYDLLTQKQTTEQNQVARLNHSNGMDEMLGELLDEAIFCFIKRREFHQLNLLQKLELVRRRWLPIFLLELATNVEVELEFESLPSNSVTSKEADLTHQLAHRLQNFVQL